MKREYMEDLRHELLSDIADVTESLLVDYKVDLEKAHQCGRAVADRLAERWGGQTVPIPKDYRFKLSSRDLQIWEEFNGRNHRQLAFKYDLSVNAIYRIIKRITPRAVAKHQHDMFSKPSQ